MIIFYILLMVVKVFWKPFRIWITRSIIFPTFMFYILPPQVKLRTVAGAKPPTALVASGRMSTDLKYFFIAKSLRRKALRKGRKDPTRRWGQWDSHRRVLIGQGWPLFHSKKWLSQTSKSIRDFFFFSFSFQSHSTIRRDSSIDSASKSIGGVEYRKHQCRVLLRFTV